MECLCVNESYDFGAEDDVRLYHTDFYLDLCQYHLNIKHKKKCRQYIQVIQKNSRMYQLPF